ncbi:tRNA (adenine(58)-N(1))-methyltransferase, mitochondrial isoform X2 [Excalfactoria chinensis]|uniref:tRNA (adenine(58)-N(1))-methyltransferase, mitochondrial isoform X2 n=1 Tax=Excalfactoria chinensis TaxID=46218 RepID=UPI003B3AFECD
MALPARLLRRAFSSASDGRRRRRVWATSLSPLERLKRMLPPEEVAAVERFAEPRSSASPQAPPKEKMAAPSAAPTVAPFPQGSPEKKMAARLSPLRAGELALAELRRKHNATLKLLCRLEAGAVLNSHGGLLPHRDIIGQLPGQLLRSSAGARLLLRRPSLDEYVLLMPRGPTIAYPKDVSAMLMMMDIHPGDVVLESGSGSGALSLFLSRAVGPQGRVISYEIRDDHHNLAKKNYRQWLATWQIGHTEEWPDNVDFVLKDISRAAEDMKSLTFDAIVLDMLNPQSALSVVHPSLKEGGVCAVYLANITQVIDLLDRIRTRRLPFACEKIVEVTHRNWSVLPAKIKNCKSSQRAESQEDGEEDPQQKECDEIQTGDQIALNEGEGNESFPDNAETPCAAPYIARPSRWQDAHSAFLTKLRKFRPPLS